MGLLEDCKSLFDSEDLYHVLGVADKKASDAEIKKAYYKMSLKVHPDRVDEADKTTANQKFQAISHVYNILADQEKRTVYDETGEIDDESDATQERDWLQYWRVLFKEVTVKDIEEFEKTYKESEEELNDLKTAYMLYEGNMDKILDHVMCSTVDDEPRFKQILEKLIQEDELPDFDQFSKEKKHKKKARRKKAEQEAREVETAKEDLGLSDDSALHALIKQKNQSRRNEADNFFEHLEERYAKTKKKVKKGK